MAPAGFCPPGSRTVSRVLINNRKFDWEFCGPDVYKDDGWIGRMRALKEEEEEEKERGRRRQCKEDCHFRGDGRWVDVCLCVKRVFPSFPQLSNSSNRSEEEEEI